MDKRTVETWVERYLRAWSTNDPQDIGQLFAEEALYYTGPFDEPWRGQEGIVQGWLDRKDEPGTWSFRYQVLVAADSVGVVRGWAQYHNPDREYSNIWAIHFDEQGRCTEFTEWWMQRKQHAAGG